MFQFPPLPTWDGLHPLIIHFPIGLLLIAPLFILLGAVVEPRRGRMFLMAALLMLILGTSAIFVAIETGESAAKLADRSPEISAVLERHEGLAERTKLAFSVLTFLLAVIIFLPAILKRELPRGIYVGMPIVFLFLYAGGMLLLSNTAHNGGRLVHEFGVHALVAPTPGQPGTEPTSLPGDKENEVAKPHEGN
jgi:uncharacterized membrane protein